MNRRVCYLFILLSSLCLSHSAVSDDGKHLFILSGQSNMRQPLPSEFENFVSEVFGKKNVTVVTVARPSQPIKQWYKKWTPPPGKTAKEGETYGAMYNSLIKRVKSKIKDQNFSSVTYIWMQGEADASSGWGTVYKESFTGVLDQLKEDLKLEKINFVIGRINDYWLPEKDIIDGKIVRDIQVRLGEENDNGDWVNTDDLNSGLNPWGIYELEGGHFPPSAYRVIGQRFAFKACNLIKPDLKLTEESVKAKFFDSTAGIQKHSAEGRKINCSISGINPAKLTDGKFGSENLKDKEWLKVPAQETQSEFTVDLGEKTEIKQVGLSILYHKDGFSDLPKSLQISLSEDGKSYKQLGKSIRFFYNHKVRNRVMKDIKAKTLLILADGKKINARYIKISIDSDKEFLMDEIIVNPE